MHSYNWKQKSNNISDNTSSVGEGFRSTEPGTCNDIF
jgi:hypothetical protein